jgi:squalene cyclase
MPNASLCLVFCPYAAVCYTYGTWFGIEALARAGHTIEGSKPLQKACDFLLSKQRHDGSWGESYLSCQVWEQ